MGTGNGHRLKHRTFTLQNNAEPPAAHPRISDGSLMDLAAYIDLAARRGASDLHIEAGRPIALRVRGQLTISGAALTPQHTHSLARQLFNDTEWAACLKRGSADLALDLAGRRCRINVLRTSRGIGLAVRLLSDQQVSIDALNLHPDLKQLIDQPHGLILVSGPTGSGKSSTQAAMVQEVNLTRTAHIVTIEQPIEYELTPVRSYLRQREVGRDTPSFAQGLLDSLREDPDVLMIGEMREAQTMRLTLDACETGHLVLATVHSSTPWDAVQRIVSAFPAEQQSSVRSQLADNLVAVICQRLVWRNEIELRVPECAILRNSSAVRSNIRSGDFFKLPSTMQTGARDGHWTQDRYRTWLDARKNWAVPSDANVSEFAGDVQGDPERQASSSGPLDPASESLGANATPAMLDPVSHEPGGAPDALGSNPGVDPSEVFRIDDESGSLADILKQLEGDGSV
ncbi:MAG: twitching motility protein PilT [Pseudohongiellaceae bacterium]|jgi:twitching motility protein PilT